MNKKEIISLLSLDELEFASTLTEQLQDNMDYLTVESKSARNSKGTTDLVMLAYETERLNNRNEILLNLLSKQIESTNEKIEKAITELFDLKEVDND
ncbi:hypothetical protein [Marinilactibacillus sp. Marseille-P9653]|uniref:hypothetical protein n=1 Tax=Marinilactibacillus sp. Marseille-P9653 TaxID=2866583 RepID=UPI001CE3CB9E|nr:hypothetical protein [Marinilactibacillus sp. Marseille-P9653]